MAVLVWRSQKTLAAMHPFIVRTTDVGRAEGKPTHGCRVIRHSAGWIRGPVSFG